MSISAGTYFNVLHHQTCKNKIKRLICGFAGYEIQWFFTATAIAIAVYHLLDLTLKG